MEHGQKKAEEVWVGECKAIGCHVRVSQTRRAGRETHRYRQQRNDQQEITPHQSTLKRSSAPVLIYRWRHKSKLSTSSTWRFYLDKLRIIQVSTQLIPLTVKSRHVYCSDSAINFSSFYEIVIFLFMMKNLFQMFHIKSPKTTTNNCF